MQRLCHPFAFATFLSLSFNFWSTSTLDFFKTKWIISEEGKMVDMIFVTAITK